MMKAIDFAHLIYPLTVDSFFKKHWEQQYLYQQHKPGYFNQVLVAEDIDLFLSQQNLHPDGIRLVNKGKTASLDDFTKMETLLGGKVKTIVCAEKVYGLFHQGATIIINSAEKTIPRLANACRIIEQQLNIRVQSNIYITPPHSQGFDVHYDSHDIFTMQIKGPKTWKIYAPSTDLPTTYTQLTEEPKLLQEIEMNSGDFLYMPRGVIHEAFTSAVATIHVNFSCKPRYGFHLLADLVKEAEKNDVFFRKTIPHLLSSEAEKNEYKILFANKIQQLIEKINIDDLLSLQQTDFIQNQILNFKGLLLNSLALEKLNINSIVSKRTGFSYQIKDLPTETLITFGKQKLRVPSFVNKELLLQNSPFQIKDLVGLITDKGKVALISSFIKAGFLQIDKN